MLKRPFLISLLLLAGTFFASVAMAGATTYSYTGPNYDNDIFGSYTSSMRLTGSFTITAPLPANLPATDISAQLVDYSFFDGVTTRTMADSRTVVFSVSTDSTGDIVAWSIVAWQLPATAKGAQTTDFHGIDSVWDPAPTGPADLGDDVGDRFCNGQTALTCVSATYPGINEAHAGDAFTPPNPPGVWVGPPGPEVVAAPAPSLTWIGTGLLSLLMFGIGMVFLRRN